MIGCKVYTLNPVPLDMSHTSICHATGMEVDSSDDSGCVQAWERQQGGREIFCSTQLRSLAGVA